MRKGKTCTLAKKGDERNSVFIELDKNCLSENYRREVFMENWE